LRCAVFGSSCGAGHVADRLRRRSLQKKEGRGELEGLAKGFLGFVVLVVVTLVEGVGAVADYVGADAHVFAAVLAGPIFGSLQKGPARALAADFFVDNEAIDFGARRDFDERHAADVDPADYAGGFFFRDKASGFPFAKEELEATSHFERADGIAELRGEFREADGVGCSYFANDERGF